MARIASAVIVFFPILPPSEGLASALGFRHYYFRWHDLVKNTGLFFFSTARSSPTSELTGAAITSNLRFNQSTCDIPISPRSDPTTCSVRPFDDPRALACTSNHGRDQSPL